MRTDLRAAPRPTGSSGPSPTTASGSGAVGPGAAAGGDTASDPELVVDWLRCVGHGVCAAAFGERIGRDEWGYPNGVSARGIPITPADRAAARMAVRTCPAAALGLDRRS